MNKKVLKELKNSGEIDDIIKYIRNKIEQSTKLLINGFEFDELNDLVKNLKNIFKLIDD